MTPVGFSNGSHSGRRCSSACNGTATSVTGQRARSLLLIPGRVHTAVSLARASDSSALISARVACPAAFGANRFAAQIPPNVRGNPTTAKTMKATTVTAIWCSLAVASRWRTPTVAGPPWVTLTRLTATHTQPTTRITTATATPTAV